MADRNHILLFPHEHTDLLGAMQGLSVHSRTRPKLHDLLTAASTDVNDIATMVLNGPERATIGEFEDLTELAERHVRQQRPSFVAEMVLLTTLQIGQLLIFAEENPSVLLARASNVLFPVGYGVGLIAAAVAATASNTDEIVRLGVEAVATALRLAISLQRTGSDIEDSDGTWARVVSGSSLGGLDQQLQQMNDTLLPLHHAYIGQVLPGSIVVFGPPSTMDSLAQRPNSPLAIALPAMPARSPLYGSHLPPVDTTDIVGVSSVLDAYTIQRPLYSAHSPISPLSVGTLGELLRVSVVEIAHKQTRIEETLLAVVAMLRESGTCHVVLTTIGSTWDVSIAQRILQQHGQQVHVGEAAPCPRPLGDGINTIPPDTLAVVGMSGRFPECDTLDEFWHLLENGMTTHQEIPPSRFCIDDFYDESRRTHNALLARHGCFIKRPGDFDHRLFNISPCEALRIDPVQRMLLMTTYEALEMAGYAAAEDEMRPPRIAAYFGQTVDDWKTINEQHGIDAHYVPAINRSFTPGRLSHYFHWSGGFYSIDTGCSSSATAVCLARDALAKRECDAAVAGGGTLLNAPEWFAGLSQGGFLSPTGACKTYSDRADGYCRGEGVAALVLKRLADAIRAKDNVLAVVAAGSRNCNAGAGSISYPGEQAQAALYRRVLRQAGVRPADVGVVEMHGTGTQAGDRVEMKAVRSVFASPDERQRDQPLIVGAVKANIGHSGAAAGVTSLIKAILILRHNSIPPQPGQPFTLNPHLAPIGGPGADIQLANGQPWPRNQGTPRYIVVNNFDAAGGNVSLLLHDAPPSALPPSTRPSDERAYHVIVTSARTTTSQDANKKRLRQYLTQHPETNLADLAYTTTARRMHHVYRDAYVAASIPELLRQLEQCPQPPAAKSSAVFAFTGQGSQYAGMGGKLYHTSPTFRRLLDSYQHLCDAQGLACKFVDVIRTPGHETTTGRDMQVAVVALEIALAQYWQSLGLRPVLVIGHSLGEYAALCVAGVLSVGDALALACERATLISTRCKPLESGMLAVALPATAVQESLQHAAAGCEVTCLNEPSNTVVGGPVAAIEALQDYLQSSGKATTTRLRVQYAYHTRQMDPVLEHLELAASRVRFCPPAVAMASTLLGRVVRPQEDGVFNAQYLRRHMRERVVFVDAVRASEAQGLIKDDSLVIEIGPHPICIGLMATSLQEVHPATCPSLRRGRNDWESISQCLAAAYRAQLPVAWAKFHRDHLSHLRVVGDLPTYMFDNREFWLPYKSTPVPNKTHDAILHASPLRVRRVSAYLHPVEQLRKQGTRLCTDFMVDMSDPNLVTAISGHVVDGVAICPASVLIDMAYTVAIFLQREKRNVSSASLATYEVACLNMLAPLVLPEDARPPRVFVEGVLEQSTDVVSVRFLSRQEGFASSPVEYASCLVRLNQLDAPVTGSWSQRMKSLANGRLLDDAGRHAHTINKSLFYDMLSEIVDYSTHYHAVESATVAANFRDATMVLQGASTMDFGAFTCSPFAIDPFVHIAGFLLNASVDKPRDEAHIANHIGSLRILGDLSSQEAFLAYATIREQDAQSGTSKCDVYITDGKDKLVALCTDIHFKKLQRGWFALLVGSAATLPKSHSRAGPRREWHLEKPTGALPSSSSGTVDLSAKLFELVALWSGIDVAELESTTDTTFAEIGIDSQMSIAILADFKTATAVELPAAFFTNFPTTLDVQKELHNQQQAYITNHALTVRAASCAPSTCEGRRQSKALRGPSEQLFRLIIDALGLEARDLTPSTTFESIGMDSRLSSRILSAFQSKTQIELPAAFFTNQRTVAAAQEALDAPLEMTGQEGRWGGTHSVQKPGLSDNLAAKTTSRVSRQQKIDSAVSRAVLIQGHTLSQAAPLFLTCAGSGTVETYIHLRALSHGRRIYALDSPFLECPETFDLSVEEMASVFIRTIRKIQPRGPYLLGGWSAGAIYACEMAHRLIKQGEAISVLIILDMRVPSLTPINIVTHGFVDKTGALEGITRVRDIAEDLFFRERAHLVATCRALSRYEAPAFPANSQPRNVVVVWARQGLNSTEDAPIAAMGCPGLDIGKSLDEMTPADFERYFKSWFYGRREHFGTNGWEAILGHHILVHCVEGDHFSMMAPPFCEAVGTIIVDAVTLAVAEE